MSENPCWYEDTYIYNSSPPEKDCSNLSARQIFELLKRDIYGQDEALKELSIQLYLLNQKHIRTVNLYAGPSGSGKSEMLLTARKYFPNIYIFDSSRLTPAGFRGSKFTEFFNSVPPNQHCLIAFDELDKTILESTSDFPCGMQIQSEMLYALSGGKVEVLKDKDTTYQFDTSFCSFALLGAFSNAASEIANSKSQKTSIGFNNSVNRNEIKPYTEGFTIQDLKDIGLLDEFIGRIDSITTLNILDENIFYRILNNPKSGPIKNLQDQYGVIFHLPNSMKKKLAKEAYESHLGTRYILNHLKKLAKEAIFMGEATKYVERFEDAENEVVWSN